MTRRVILGQRDNGNYGLFVSAPGVDAGSASDNSLIFSSMAPHSAVIHQKGTVGLSGTAFSTVSFTALPYIPMVVLGYYVPASNTYMFSQSEASAFGGGYTGNYNSPSIGPKAIITTSQLQVAAFSDHGTNWQVKYVILRAPGGS